jgi:hypothetical protein
MSLYMWQCKKMAKKQNIKSIQYYFGAFNVLCQVGDNKDLFNNAIQVVASFMCFSNIFSRKWVKINCPHETMAHLILIGDLVPHNYAWIATLEQKDCVWIL